MTMEFSHPRPGFSDGFATLTNTQIGSPRSWMREISGGKGGELSETVDLGLIRTIGESGLIGLTLKYS